MHEISPHEIRPHDITETVHCTVLGKVENDLLLTSDQCCA